jgi:hypothetical protein
MVELVKKKSRPLISGFDNAAFKIDFDIAQLPKRQGDAGRVPGLSKRLNRVILRSTRINYAPNPACIFETMNSIIAWLEFTGY